MENDFTFGIWSLLPLVIALVIAFRTRSATFALMTGCITGVVMAGSFDILSSVQC